MVRIPAGTYRIGADDTQHDERPAHEVVLDAFQIDRTEVSNAHYKVFVDGTGHKFPQHWRHDGSIWPRDEQLPVIWVTWEDASTYANWRNCRLPTEAEWEVAAKGTTDVVWPWGPVFADSTLGRPPAHTGDDSSNLPTGPVVIGSYPGGASPFGALDMAGNVWEWVADSYAPSAYRKRSESQPVHNPLGPATIPFAQRLIRGGSWFDARDDARVTNRQGADPRYANDTIGIRCVCPAEPE